MVFKCSEQLEAKIESIQQSLPIEKQGLFCRMMAEYLSEILDYAIRVCVVKLGDGVAKLIHDITIKVK